jgi:hypothetical protein
VSVRAALTTTSLLALTAACGSGAGAPSGAVTDCGRIAYRGAYLPAGTPAAQSGARCFVAAVHACRAARLELDHSGVDTGFDQVLTVRRASGGTCVTALATTSSVLTRTTHRHEVCREASVVTDGVALSECTKSG